MLIKLDDLDPIIATEIRNSIKLERTESWYKTIRFYIWENESIPVAVSNRDLKHHCHRVLNQSIPLSDSRHKVLGQRERYTNRWKVSLDGFNSLYLNCLIASLDLLTAGEACHELRQLVSPFNRLAALGRKCAEFRFHIAEIYDLRSLSDFEQVVIAPCKNRLVLLCREFEEYKTTDKNKIDPSKYELDQLTIQNQSKQLESNQEIGRLIALNELQSGVIVTGFYASESALRLQQARQKMGYSQDLSEVLGSISDSITKVENQHRAYEAAVAEVLPLGRL